MNTVQCTFVLLRECVAKEAESRSAQGVMPFRKPLGIV